MRVTKRIAESLALVLFFPSFVSSAEKDPITLTLTFAKGENPLKAEKANAQLEIKNNGENAIELRTNSPFGSWAFIDTAVTDAKGVRISPEFYRASISSPFSEKRLCATIPAGKSKKIGVILFDGIKEELKPGKYKIKVRFRCTELKLDATTEEIEIELTQADIDDRKK